MGTMDDIGSKFMDVAKKTGEMAQKAAQKTGDLVEITRYNLKIKDDESVIKSRFAEIGKLVYDKYASGEAVPEEIAEHVSAIDEKKASILSYREKIEEIKSRDKDAANAEEVSLDDMVDDLFDDEKRNEMKNKAEEKFDEFKTGAKDAAEEIKESVVDAANNIKEEAKDAAEKAADKAAELKDKAESVFGGDDKKEQ